MAAHQNQVERIEGQDEDLKEIIDPDASVDAFSHRCLKPETLHLASVQWSEILAPYLESTLSCHGSYELEAIRQHLEFFNEQVVPWIGPGPVSDTSEGSLYRPRYLSSMTNDFTPFEISCCWKNQNQRGRPIVRYVTDVAPSLPEENRVSSLTRALQAIESLRSRASNPQGSLCLSVFPDLWTHITQNFIQYESQIHHNPCSSCGASSTFLAFDLVNLHIKAKLYWLLPSCQTTPQLLQMLDHVLLSCGSVHSFFNSSAFIDAWHTIRDHIALHAETSRPRLLSIDATQYPSPRVKIYVRCLFAKSEAFDTWKSHLTLNDEIKLSTDFISTCENLWTSLTSSPDESTSRARSGPKYCLTLYEISGSSLSSKLYIMCQEIPRPDSFVAQQLLAHCRAAQQAPLLKAFAAHPTHSAFISEIGLAPRTPDTEVSIYLSPCWFSRHLWKDYEDDDGYLSKIRTRNPAQELALF